MYGIFNYIWLICMVNVGKYTIHGWYGMGYDQGYNLPSSSRNRWWTSGTLKIGTCHLLYEKLDLQSCCFQQLNLQCFQVSLWLTCGPNRILSQIHLFPPAVKRTCDEPLHLVSCVSHYVQLAPEPTFGPLVFYFGFLS